MIPSMEEGKGKGDGTVPWSSATALFSKEGSLKRPPPAGLAQPSFGPGDSSASTDHQNAFAKGTVQEWTIRAIKAWCRVHYEKKRRKL